MTPRATYAHPVALGALALLLVNDHLLKTYVPGPVTGKLSDVAGPVVAAALAGPLAVRLTRWPRAEVMAWWAVAVLFAAVKTVPVANVAAVALLTALTGPAAIVRDPTDVLGLVALPFAWRWTRSAPARPPRALRVVAAVVACGAVTATSAAPQPRVDVVRVRDDAVVAVVDDGSGAERTWTSTDGRQWRKGEPAVPLSPPEPYATQACHERHCYRIASEFVVEESTDGGVTWHDSVTSGRDFPPDSPRAVVFLPGQDVALVAVGEAGVLRRDGTAPWQSVAVGKARPGEEDEPPLLPTWLLAATLLGVVSFVVFVIWAQRRAASRPASRPAPGSWPFDAPLPRPLPPPPPPPPAPPARGRYRRR